MPSLSTTLIRAALAWLIAGACLGVGMLVQRALGGPVSYGLVLAHQEILLVGWLPQFAMGVAFWILPRFPHGPPRGEERLVVAAGWLLNIGLVIGAVAHVFAPSSPLVAVGRVLFFFAVACFGSAIWPRVRPVLRAA